MLSHRRRLRRSQGERGGVLLELALVVPFLMTLCMAILDLGLGWRADLNLTNAVRTGVRVGAAQGSASGADHTILVSVGSALGRIPPEQVRRVIVFRSTSATGSVPAACTTAVVATSGGSSVDSCNVYSNSDLLAALASPTSPPASFTGPCGTARRDRFWCPLTRDNEAGVNGLGLDYLGVYLEVDHPTSTKIFGPTLEIDDSAVMRIEPEAGA